MSEIIQKKKEDGRIRYTKLRIREAFYELLQEVGYDKVTVTALCQRAEINRATFYKHYLDIPDLLDKLQEAAIEELADKLSCSDHNTIESFITEALKYIHRSISENTVLSTFVVQSGQGFSERITKLFYNRFSGLLEKSISKEKNMSTDMLFSYISAGSAGVIDYWSKSGFHESEEEIAKAILDLTRRTINLKQKNSHV